MHFSVFPMIYEVIIVKDFKITGRRKKSLIELSFII